MILGHVLVTDRAAYMSHLAVSRGRCCRRGQTAPDPHPAPVHKNKWPASRINGGAAPWLDLEPPWSKSCLVRGLGKHGHNSRILAHETETEAFSLQRADPSIKKVPLPTCLHGFPQLFCS